MFAIFYIQGMIFYAVVVCRFMESEVELNAIINEMHIIATVPHLYQIIVNLNAIQSLLQLLSHENTGKLCKLFIYFWIKLEYTKK